MFHNGSLRHSCLSQSLEVMWSSAPWWHPDRHLVVCHILELFRRKIPWLEMRLMGILCAAVSQHLWWRVWVSQKQSGHFPSTSELSLKFGFCQKRVTDTLGSSFLFMFRLWVALWSALLCCTNLKEMKGLLKKMKENASSFCNFVLINKAQALH